MEWVQAGQGASWACWAGLGDRGWGYNLLDLHPGMWAVPLSLGLCWGQVFDVGGRGPLKASQLLLSVPRTGPQSVSPEGDGAGLADPKSAQSDSLDSGRGGGTGPS